MKTNELIDSFIGQLAVSGFGNTDENQLLVSDTKMTFYCLEILLLQKPELVEIKCLVHGHFNRRLSG